MATLVFMAAGFGTRFGGGIKQIEPVGPNGEVLMDYAVHDALKAGFDHVVFILRRDIEEEFKAGIGKRTEAKCRVDYVFQDTEDLPEGFSLPEGRKKPWGTAHAVLACRNVLNGPFCVLNADDFYGERAFRDMYAFLNTSAKGNTLGMCGYVLRNTLSENGSVTRGICEADEKGMLVKIDETKNIVLKDGRAFAGERELNLDSTVSMNIWAIPATFMDILKEGFPRFLREKGLRDNGAEYLLPDVVAELLKEGRCAVKVMPTCDRWFGMTYARDQIETAEQINALIAEGVYPAQLG